MRDDGNGKSYVLRSVENIQTHPAQDSKGVKGCRWRMEYCRKMHSHLARKDIIRVNLCCTASIFSLKLAFNGVPSERLWSCFKFPISGMLPDMRLLPETMVRKSNVSRTTSQRWQARRVRCGDVPNSIATRFFKSPMLEWRLPTRRLFPN